MAKSPDDATPALAYERGWNALNELIRSDSSWSGYERNVMFANNRDGTFAEVSGAVGMDFPEDGRSFVLADLDHDGRLEVILKNRNAPQLRILHNAMQDIGHSISFRLRGKKSNRDAIGAAITIESGALRQTKYLQAGSGFLAQHSKEVFFGAGQAGRNDSSDDSLAERALAGMDGSAGKPSNRSRRRLRRICGQSVRRASSCVCTSRPTAGARTIAHSSGHMADRTTTGAGVFLAGSRR